MCEERSDDGNVERWSKVSAKIISCGKPCHVGCSVDGFEYQHATFNAGLSIQLEAHYRRQHELVDDSTALHLLTRSADPLFFLLFARVW